jgi:hypothetical protein
MKSQETQYARSRYLNAKRSGRLQVDDEFEFGGLHDGKVGGLRALENLTSVEADLTPRVRRHSKRHDRQNRNTKRSPRRRGVG